MKKLGIVSLIVVSAAAAIIACGDTPPPRVAQEVEPVPPRQPEVEEHHVAVPARGEEQPHGQVVRGPFPALLDQVRIGARPDRASEDVEVGAPVRGAQVVDQKELCLERKTALLGERLPREEGPIILRPIRIALATTSSTTPITASAPAKDISRSTCVNSGWRSARRSSSRKQRAIWK